MAEDVEGGPSNKGTPGGGPSPARPPGRVLTGHGLLVADAFIEAAAELLAAIPADVVVAYVVQRDVAHCKATHGGRHPAATAPLTRSVTGCVAQTSL